MKQHAVLPALPVTLASAVLLAHVVSMSLSAAESAPTAEAGNGEAAVERVALFEDTVFRRGFDLSSPSSAKGRVVEKVLEGIEAKATGAPGASGVGLGATPALPVVRPAWRLCQWATRVSLAAAPRVDLPDGAVSYEDETKRVVFGGGSTGGPDLVLDLRAVAEYEGRTRKAGEAWPHLLVEQDTARVFPLDRLKALELAVDLRLSVFVDGMKEKADPGLHAAQFQLFFIVKDVAPGGTGDFLWFGVPFFDSRAEYPPGHQAKDGGKDDATGKFIYSIDGREALPASLRGGRRVAIRKDLLPFIRDALVCAVRERFLESADPARYAVVNMNLGWEMPGAYDAAVEVRGLAITAVVEKGDAALGVDAPPKCYSRWSSRWTGDR
jgi:hypothetical protein